MDAKDEFAAPKLRGELKMGSLDERAHELFLEEHRPIMLLRMNKRVELPLCLINVGGYS